MKKAAEALEKLADAAREELPATMASIRLSGMEISDLTMELNGLGYVLTPEPQLLSVSRHDDSNVWEIDMKSIVDSRHEISKGAKSSANALNAVESGMRKVGGLASNGECQTSYHHIQFDKSYILRTITLNLFDDHELFTLSDSLESA